MVHSEIDTRLVLVSARKSRGADHWDKDDYDVEAPVAATGKVLFQADSVALLAERFFGVEIIRASGVAVLDAGAWPASGSPLV